MFVANFRDVLFSLQQRFEIIIVELPPLMIPVLPLHLMQMMHGLLVVIDSTRTTKTDVSRIVQRIGKDRILGFVLNRVPEEK
jgi:Mrp family chromosome partitioning ATPase